MKSVLVTGTSSGIGLATAVHLAEQGYRVFAGMRNTGKADPLRQAAAESGVDVELLQMDICDTDSVQAAIAQASADTPLDVLINNAGIGGSTPLELVPEEEHQQMFDTNYFGAVRCIQAVLPAMRERGSGCIVNITSAVGLLAMPNQIPYSASKWALECLGEALAHEMVRFGVRVVNVEPGVILTDIFDNSAEQTRYDKNSPYQPLMRRNGKFYAAGFKRGARPEQVAATIQQAIEQEAYQLRWPVGTDAQGMMAARHQVPSEQWVALGADLSDEEYNERVEGMFGIRL